MDIKNRVEDIDRKSNPVQRVIVAVVVPIVVVLVGWGIMSWLNSSGSPVYALKYDFSPTTLDETWWAWLIIILAIGAFEFFWFRTRE